MESSEGARMAVINGNSCGQIVSNKDWRLSNEIPGVRIELMLTMELFSVALHLLLRAHR